MDRKCKPFFRIIFPPVLESVCQREAEDAFSLKNPVSDNKKFFVYLSAFQDSLNYGKYSLFPWWMHDLPAQKCGIYKKIQKFCKKELTRGGRMWYDSKAAGEEGSQGRKKQLTNRKRCGKLEKLPGNAAQDLEN